MYSLYDAAKRYRNPLTSFYFKGIVTEDELFARLPFIPKDGNAFAYTREKSLGSAAFVASGGTVNESSPTSDTISVPVREVATDCDIANFAIAQQGGDRVVMDAMMKKGKAVGQLLAGKIITGGFVTSHTLGSSADPFAAIDAISYGPWLDSTLRGPGEIKYTHAGTLWQFRAPGDRDFGAAVAAAADGSYTLKSDNPSYYITVTLDVSDATTNGRTTIEFTSSGNEFDGLLRMISTGQTRAPVGTDGDDLSFDILDQLIDAVKVRDNLAFVMNAALRRKYKNLYRALGGTIPDVVIGGFDPQGNPADRRVLAYEGIPILKSDNIASTESVGSTTTCSSIALVSLTPEEGFFVGAFGGASEQMDADPISRVVLGFQTIYVGNLETKNQQRWRQVFYGAPALGSELAAARARGIKTA